MADVNELIGGYKLRTLLQTGQLSQVFEVTEPKSGLHYAMKLLLPEAAVKSEHRNALFNEAEVGIKLTHPNVCRIFKVNKSETNPHFTTCVTSPIDLTGWPPSVVCVLPFMRPPTT